MVITELTDIYSLKKIFIKMVSYTTRKKFHNPPTIQKLNAKNLINLNKKLIKQLCR